MIPSPNWFMWLEVGLSKMRSATIYVFSLFLSEGTSNGHQMSFLTIAAYFGIFTPLFFVTLICLCACYRVFCMKLPRRPLVSDITATGPPFTESQPTGISSHYSCDDTSYTFTNSVYIAICSLLFFCNQKVLIQVVRIFADR